MRMRFAKPRSGSGAPSLRGISLSGLTEFAYLESMANSFEELLADEYAALPMVEAVALGGSRVGPFAEAGSDYDLYVYTNAAVPMEAREAIARGRAASAETNNNFWEPGDEWVEVNGERVDAMFRDCLWIEDQLARVLDRHEASIGYSTAFWFNVRTARLLFDRVGWFARLQNKAQSPYPEPLRRNIVAKNHPILRGTQSSYVHQLESALKRQDLVSTNHRTTALLASFFDILFAMNRQPHSGEKRLLPWSAHLCPLRPPRMEEQIAGLISTNTPDRLKIVHALLDDLDALLRAERLI